MSEDNSRQAQGQPQLRMRRGLDDLPELPQLPKGLRLRQMGEQDISAYVDLMQANAEFGEWSAGRVERMAAEGIPLTEISVVEDDQGRLLATACLAPAPSDFPPSSVELGWVATRPSAKRRGLGWIVCVAAMQRAKARGFKEILLRTDDWRLPALSLYLKLGFRPEYSHSTYRARWSEVFGKLRSSPRSPARAIGDE